MFRIGQRIGLLIGGVFFGIFLFSFPAYAKEGFNFSGTITSDLAFHQYQESDNTTIIKSAAGNTFRLNFKNLIGSNAKVEGSFNLLLLAGDYADSYLAINPDRVNHSWEVFGTRVQPLFETRKLYLSLFHQDSTFTIGRQIINYGVGYLFSPIDCFSAVNLQDVSLSRKGSDILRIQIPLGEVAGIEGVSTFAAPADNTISAVKVFGNQQGYDLSLTGIYNKNREEYLLGFTFKGDLLLGVHGEFVEHYNTNSKTQNFEGMVGADYSLGEGKWFLLAEYYYNDNPLDPTSLNPDQLADLGRTFFGKDYLFYQVNYTLDEIRQLYLNQIYNLGSPEKGSKAL